MSRAAWVCSILLGALILESLFSINVYVMIGLICAAFWLAFHIMDEQMESIMQRKSMQLQSEINYTSKDAHLKYKQLTTMISSIPYPMLLLNQQGAIVMHNHFAQKLTVDGIKDHITYLKNPFPKSIQEFIKDAFILERKMDQMIEVNGVEYQAISVPVTSKSKFSGCFIMLQDISKTLEGEKMQKRFIADASHELKTPIAVIKGMVEILNREDFDDPATQMDFLHQIEAETNRLDEMVRDMLELSRMSVNKPILNRSKQDMAALLEQTIHPLENVAKKKQLKIVRDFQVNDQVFCDPVKMGQVFTNLITNAVKYSDHGEITIRTSKTDKYFQVEIKDCGCGLSEKQKTKIFDRFYRVNNDRSRQSGGSGLGLAIVKSIVDAHSGRIEVQSELGKGTSFIVKLKN